MSERDQVNTGDHLPDPRTARTYWAIMLARDVETCGDLLRGEPVEPSRLNPKELARAKEQGLVSLDVRAIDLFAIPVDEVDDDDWDSWFRSLPSQVEAAA